jgi:hypothetical protein
MTEYVKIESTDELSSWENRILELFRKSFGRPLSPEAWRWMYLNNPNGLAYVTLAIENGQLSGHYAAVPTLLADAAGPFVAYRSMTTMVDPDSSAPGLFLRLGRRAHEELTQSGIKLIYGFPNANSAFTFERFMRWRMVEAHEIADVPGRAILGSPGIRADLLTRGPVRWNLEDAGQAAWRLSNPGSVIEDQGGLIIKHYGALRNILHVDEDGIERIDPDQSYRVLLGRSTCLDHADVEVQFPYQFGYRWLQDRDGQPPVKPELIMSDVF